MRLTLTFISILNAIILASALVLLVKNWRVFTPEISKRIITLIVAALLICIPLMFIEGALPLLEGWAAVFVVLGFLGGFFERRYRKRSRQDL